MNDYTAISEITKNTENMNILITFILINILTTIIQIVSNFMLKSKEKSIYSHNLKENKRIKKLEECYNKLEKLTYFDGKNDNEIFLNKIAEIDTFVTTNGLYIDSKYFKIINEINDYFRTVLSDFRKKDYKREKILFSNYTSEFNK